MLGFPEKMREAIGLRLASRRAEYFRGESWPIEAVGARETRERAHLCEKGRPRGLRATLQLAAIIWSRTPSWRKSGLSAFGRIRGSRRVAANVAAGSIAQANIPEWGSGIGLLEGRLPDMRPWVERTRQQTVAARARYRKVADAMKIGHFAPARTNEFGATDTCCALRKTCRSNAFENTHRGKRQSCTHDAGWAPAKGGSAAPPPISVWMECGVAAAASFSRAMRESGRDFIFCP